MKAFWWFDENSIAGMARPGFNSAHWLDLKFDEAALLGWLGLHSSGRVSLQTFRDHLQTYVPKIYRYHKLNEVTGPQAIQVFQTEEGFLEVLNRLSTQLQLLEDFKIADDHLYFRISEQRLQHEIDFVKSKGIRTIVTLTEKHHSADTLKKHFNLHHFGIADLGAPQVQQAEHLAEVIKYNQNRNEKMAVHCLAGIGRTSTMILAAHLLLGESLEALMAKLARQNPKFALSESQSDFVKRVAGR